MEKYLACLMALLCLACTPGVAALTYQQGSHHARQPVDRSFCVFDVAGKHGDSFRAMDDYRLRAMEWGVDLDVRVYQDERIAAEHFRAGLCDGVSVTGLRGRGFNSFTGTLDSIGSIPSYRHLRVALATLASPKMERYMHESGYEVVGIIPGGSAHLFVRDRDIDSLKKMLGKRVAVLDFDVSQARMATSIGASPVSASIATIGPMFNNGAVDVIAAPAVAYEPLELYRGLGETGAIGRQAVGQLTFQLIIHPDRFPDGFGQRSRDYIFAQYDQTISLINKYTRVIPEKSWLDISAEHETFYAEIFRQTRLMLRDQGFYNGTMLKFLSRVRCKLNPGLAECTAPDRE